jgi:hypothetical protein
MGASGVLASSPRRRLLVKCRPNIFDKRLHLNDEASPIPGVSLGLATLQAPLGPSVANVGLRRR